MKASDVKRALNMMANDWTNSINLVGTNYFINKGLVETSVEFDALKKLISYQQSDENSALTNKDFYIQSKKKVINQKNEIFMMQIKVSNLEGHLSKIFSKKKKSYQN